MGLFGPARLPERPEDVQRRAAARDAARAEFEAAARRLFGLFVGLGFPESSAAELAFAGRLLGSGPGGGPALRDDADTLQTVVYACTEAINACLAVAATFAAGSPQQHLWLERVDDGYATTRRYFVVTWLNALIRTGSSSDDAVETLRVMEGTFTERDRDRPSQSMWIGDDGFLTTKWLLGRPAILPFRPTDA